MDKTQTPARMGRATGRDPGAGSYSPGAGESPRECKEQKP